MLPDRVSNPGPLTYESGALPIALRGRPPGLVVYSNDDLRSILFFFFVFFQWQGQICFLCFDIRRDHGLCRRFSAKVNKYSKISEHKNFFLRKRARSTFDVKALS